MSANHRGFIRQLHALGHLQSNQTTPQLLHINSRLSYGCAVPYNKSGGSVQELFCENKSYYYILYYTLYTQYHSYMYNI